MWVLLDFVGAKPSLVLPYTAYRPCRAYLHLSVCCGGIMMDLAGFG